MESVHPGVVYLGLVFMLPQGGSFVYIIIIIIISYCLSARLLFISNSWTHWFFQDKQRG